MREGHFKATLPFRFPAGHGYDIGGCWSPRHLRAPGSREAMRSTPGYPTAGLGAYAERAVVPLGLLARQNLDSSFLRRSASLPTVALRPWQAFSR